MRKWQGWRGRLDVWYDGAAILLTSTLREFEA